mmetsp:Transcript_12072/g.17492  ORF Transcript_12072/g.17492 Transcript_12072/m.17492 type:complete len:114 (+) Transcript_12072:70-411(+)
MVVKTKPPTPCLSCHPGENIDHRLHLASDGSAANFTSSDNSNICCITNGDKKRRKIASFFSNLLSRNARVRRKGTSKDRHSLARVNNEISSHSCASLITVKTCNLRNGFSIST